MKLSIENQLESQKQDEKAEFESAFNNGNAKLLSEKADSKEQEILRSLCPNSNAQFIVEERGKYLELENLEKVYGTVYTRKQIQAIALDYKLRFLSSKEFIGDVDLGVVDELKKFGELTNTPINKASIEYNAFILAPAECFNMKKRSISLRLHIDPILFWKVNENHYRLIRKWGKDFSIFRALVGYKFKNSRNLRNFNLITTLPFTFLFYSWYFSADLYFKYTLTYFLIAVLSYCTALAITYIRYWFCCFDDSKVCKDLFSEENWRSTELIKEKLFI